MDDSDGGSIYEGQGHMAGNCPYPCVCRQCGNQGHSANRCPESYAARARMHLTSSTESSDENSDDDGNVKSKSPSRLTSPFMPEVTTTEESEEAGETPREDEKAKREAKVVSKATAYVNTQTWAQQCSSGELVIDTAEEGPTACPMPNNPAQAPRKTVAALAPKAGPGPVPTGKKENVKARRPQTRPDLHREGKSVKVFSKGLCLRTANDRKRRTRSRGSWMIRMEGLPFLTFPTSGAETRHPPPPCHRQKPR